MIPSLIAGLVTIFLIILQDMRTSIEDLSKMRDSCVTPERSEKGVDAMIRYFRYYFVSCIVHE